MRDDSFDVVRVRVLPDSRLERKDAAAYLGRTPKTLAHWATAGRGPRAVKVGGRVFYFLQDLDEFIRSGAPMALIMFVFAASLAFAPNLC
jgi:Helix-turn-helix domain